MGQAHSYSRGRDSVTVRGFRVALALSVLVHALALSPWTPQLSRPPTDLVETKESRGPLIVQLAPPPSPPRARPPAPPPRPALPQPRPRSAAPAPKPAPRPPPRAQPRPPVIALEQPAPERRPQPRPAPQPAPRTPSTGDLLAYVEQQRARRDWTPPPAPAAPARSVSPAEDENARANRIAAANLGLGRKPDLGAERSRSGGIFEVTRMSYDYAEFNFYGWNRDMRRNTAQVIDVRKGSHSDIRLAVVRRMISIIRDHEKGDFVWESHRLGRNLTLSARPRDQAGLEDFLMREFFEDGRAAARR